MTDDELIRGCIREDESCQREIFRRYAGKMLGVCQRYARNTMDAEDIVQDALIKVYVSKHLYREVAKFSTWIYTIAINLAKTKIIKKQKYKTFSINSAYEEEDKDFDIKDEGFLPDVDANSRFQDEHIQKALNSINENYRELIILRDVEDFSYEEICKMTGLPMGTVKSRINRGREKLQELLKDIYK